MPGHTSVGLLQRARAAVEGKQWGSAVELYTQILMETDVVEESGGESSEGTAGGSGGELSAQLLSVPECSKAMILISRAGAYLKMGEFKRCIEDAESALDANPCHVDGYRILGRANLKLKSFGHAEVAVKKGLKLEPDNQGLMKLLDEIRQDENVHAPVFVKDGSDKRLRTFQQQTGFEMDANTFPDIVRAIMVGDLQGVRETWRRAEHLKLRMTRLKIPLIHFPVIGRQRITPKVSVEEYCDVVDFLFEEGCRLDHRDRVGYTAIMHGCGPEGEHGIIQHMLKKGADPNIQSSYGTTALHDAIQSQHRDIVDTLLQHGADPIIPDNNGTTPYQRGLQFGEFIAVQTSSNTVEKQCDNCSSRCGVSRCAKCRLVCYCSKECQVAHWPSHKKQCKHIQRSFKSHVSSPIFAMQSTG